MSNKTLYQHGTLGALMAGLMDGTKTISELLELGDLGIGTLHGLDGEVIILNGEAYQGQSDGKLIKLTGEELTPYAAVTTFKADRQVVLDEGLSSEKTLNKMLTHFKSQNTFSAVKLTGVFNKMHIRIMPKQQKPYQRLVEVSKIQPEFTEEYIKGSLVGFYTPALFQGVAAAGFHLHFISEDRTFGGHVIDFELGQGVLEISDIDALTQLFPVNDTTFLETEIDYANLASEIEQAE